MTDGLENSSQECSKDQIRQLITRQQDQYSWHFTFLGANQDAFAEAGALGIAAAGAANHSPEKTQAAYMMTGGKVARMRAQRSKGETVRNEFTDEERKKML